MKSFENIAAEMKRHGMNLPPPRLNITVPNAGEVLRNALSYFLSLEGRQAMWLTEYNHIAQWLTDNRGRGLLMSGNCGRGKSIMGRIVLPAILLKYCRKVVSVFDIQEMNRNIDLVLEKPIISLDDIGTEEMSIKYGEKRLAFAEIMDAAEKKGKLLIVSTNLTGREIAERYGDRTVDRIHSTMEQVLFNGKSLRQ